MTAPEPLDPAAIMAAHEPDDDNDCRACRWSVDNETTADPWPCETYRLAEALAVESERVRELGAAFNQAAREAERQRDALTAEQARLQRVEARCAAVKARLGVTSSPTEFSMQAIRADEADKVLAALAGDTEGEQP